MSEALKILLDQNVPFAVKAWLRMSKPGWSVVHVNEVGLAAQRDEIIFEWAQKNDAVIVTFDGDFADQRSFAAAEHAGVVRLKVWPTTIEETIAGLQRLLEEVDDQEIRNSLVIIDRHKIRIRKVARSSH